VVFPWGLWVWFYVLVLEQCCSYQSIFHRLNLDILYAGRMRTCHLHRVMPVACWPRRGKVHVGLDSGTGGTGRKCCFLIFHAGCAFPSPFSWLRKVGAGKWLRSLALPHVNAVIHFFSGGTMWVMDGTCTTVKDVACHFGVTSEMDFIPRV